MCRPSLPAAIAPFRGCPAGCLRVACETLLSPSAQKGRMNNGPRQALAPNNPSLRFTLCHTFSVSKSNHELFPQNPHSFMPPISSVRSRSLQNCFHSSGWSSYPRIFSRFPFCSLNLKMALLLWDKHIESRRREHVAPQISLSSQDPVWPSPCPDHQNVHDSSFSTKTHPEHLRLVEKASLALHRLEGLELSWRTKQLFLWLITYLWKTKLQPTMNPPTHGKQQWKQWKWVRTAKQLWAITVSFIACFGARRRMFESELSLTGTCGSSVHMATLQQAKSTSVWSINNKK